jgi:serine acetyltransferase
MFGSLVHPLNDPAAPWDGNDEPAPTLADDVVVGFGALVIGGIRIAGPSFVTAGAIVTEDVPAGYVVTGRNCLVRSSDWKGTLRSSSWWTGMR